MQPGTLHVISFGAMDYNFFLVLRANSCSWAVGAKKRCERSAVPVFPAADQSELEAWARSVRAADVDRVQIVLEVWGGVENSLAPRMVELPLRRTARRHG